MPREQGAGCVDHRLRRAAELRLPRLRRAAVLRYEDLVASPASCLLALTKFLALPASAQWAREAVERGAVATDSNAKYERDYCEHHLATPAQRSQHCGAAAALQLHIDALGLGYDVRLGGALGFGCLRAELSAACEGAGATPELDAALRAHAAQNALPLLIAPLGAGSRQLCTRASRPKAERDAASPSKPFTPRPL